MNKSKSIVKEIMFFEIKQKIAPNILNHLP